MKETPPIEQSASAEEKKPKEKTLQEQVAGEPIKEVKIKGKGHKKTKEAAKAEIAPFSETLEAAEMPQKIPKEALAEDKPETAAESEKIKVEETEVKRPYTKEEWFEIVETLKGQAKDEYEKEKIEQNEEIIELSWEMKLEEPIEEVIAVLHEETRRAGEGKEPEPSKPEKPEKPERTETNKQVSLYKKLGEARRELAGSEEEWQRLMAKGMPSYEKFNRNKAVKEVYNDRQRELLELFLNKAEKRWGKNSEKYVNFRNQLIFKGLVGREQERFLKAKESALAPKEKSRIRKFTEKVLTRCAKLPKAVRWGIAAGLGTVVAFGTGGVAAPALLGYAGFRYGRAALGSMSAVGAKALGDGAEKLWLKKHGKEAREEKIRESIQKEAAAISDAEKLSHYMMIKGGQRNEELAKLTRRQKQWKVGKIAAMIGGGAGISFWAGSMDMFTHDTGVSHGLQDQLGIRGGKPVIPPPEEFLPIMPGHGPFIEIAQPGDSVWRIAEHQLENQGYFKGLTGTAEEIAAKKTYLTDWVKDQVAKDPTKFGLTDPDELVAGQKLDLTEIIGNKAAVLEKVQEANGLPHAEISHINYDDDLIKQWVKAHPGERLTSGKVAEILGGKRLGVLTEGQEPFSTENYLRGLGQEERELAETQIQQSWEDYQKLPGLNEDELRSLQDYYGYGAGKEGLSQAPDAAPAMENFYAGQVRTYDSIMEILTPSNMRPAEYLAIKNVSVGKFMDETAGGWEKWRGDEAITIDIPHDGIYGASEYGRQLKLADFIRGTNPAAAEKSLTIEEYLTKFIK